MGLVENFCALSSAHFHLRGWEDKVVSPLGKQFNDIQLVNFKGILLSAQ